MLIHAFAGEVLDRVADRAAARRARSELLRAAGRATGGDGMTQP